MNRLAYYFIAVLLVTGCAAAPKLAPETATPIPDAIGTTVSAQAPLPAEEVDTRPEPAPTPYHLTLSSQKKIRASIGVKAVVMSSNQQKVYSINLEDLSIMEFDRATQRLLRKVRFVANPGWGFNYVKKKKIRSFQEKPVEAYLTHDDRFLWVSLHNAGGVVVWDLINSSTAVANQPQKAAYLYDYRGVKESTEEAIKKTINLLWIKTGKTPKVITATSDDHWLYIANWHSHSVSVIDIRQPDPATWYVTKVIKPFIIPRGMAVTHDNQWLLVAQMGSHYLTKVAIPSHTIVSNFAIGSNPRHVVLAEPYAYVSLNKSAQLVKMDLTENQIVGQSKTARSPRTIALSHDNRFIFIVCYHANRLQVFKADDLSQVADLETYHHPVAVDVADLGDSIEVWVGNYSSGTIDVFSFNKEGTNENVAPTQPAAASETSVF